MNLQLAMPLFLLRSVYVGALGIALVACTGHQTPDSPAPVTPPAAAPVPMKKAGAATQRAMQKVQFMGGQLTIELPADLVPVMDRSELKVYAKEGQAVLLVTADIPAGIPKDPKQLVALTEASLKRQDPKLVVLGKGETQAAGRAVPWISVITHQAGKGKVYSMVAIDVRDDRLVTITQVASAEERDAYAPVAEAVVRSLSGV